MDDSFLEQYYEQIVLPLYVKAISFTTIKWKDHGKVGPDTWAHYFEDETGREFVLLYEDFPGGDYLADGLSHDIIVIGNESSVQISASTNTLVDNIFGYFTLYAEKQ